MTTHMEGIPGPYPTPKCRAAEEDLITHDSRLLAIESTGLTRVTTLEGQAAKLEKLTGGAYTLEPFNCSPVVTQITGEASDGTDTDVMAMSFGLNMFEYRNIGAQALKAPAVAADGLLCSLDLTAGEGIEITQGITTRARHAYTIGTSPAFYMKVGILVADASEIAECAVGFRKADVYNSTFDNYTDLASLNMQAGAINVETILNGDATVTTDTTDVWADTEEHVLEVYVSEAGVASYKIDGAAPKAVPATDFTFDDGDVVVPFFHLIHGGTTPAAVHLQSWEVGAQ